LATAPTSASHPIRSLNPDEGTLGDESRESESVLKFVVVHMDVIKFLK
jgi:hypothetical protein